MASDLNKFIPVCQLIPNMKNINITFIVLDVGPPRRTPQGNDVRTVRVADPTGSVLMTVWNEIGNSIAENEIWRLRNGYTSVYKGVMSLSCGKLGELLKTGEFFMLFSENPNMSEYSTDLAAKYPLTRKGSPDEETGSGSNFNVGRGSQNEMNSSVQSQLQRQQQLSTRGGALKRTAGATQVSNHRGRPVAVNVQRKISRV